MGKNYIEQFMKDNDLECGEWFLAGNKEFKQHKCKITQTYEFVMRGTTFDGSNSFFIAMIRGVHQVEKIKPKTLMEQLKKQGYGWVINIHSDGNVKKLDADNELFDELVKLNDVHLTESDAKREYYRLGLEYEMKEWARENDCLTNENARGSFNFTGFNCFIMPVGERTFKVLFRDKAEKYYMWGSSDEQ